MRRHWPFLIVAFVLALATNAQLRAQDAPSSGEQSSSSSSTWDNRAGNTNPTRTSSSHTESNGRTADGQSLQQLGPNGAYETFLDVERESVKVDASTTRVIERRYGHDVNGGRSLVQVSEEEIKQSPGGGENVVRTVSTPDMNGGMQVARREIEQTRPVAADARETTTTVLNPDINGGFTPSMRLQQREKLDAKGNVVEFRRSTSTPQADGRWQVNEVREGSVRDQSGGQKTKEERLLRPDSEGKLAVVGRTVSTESKSASGEKRQSVEKFSANVPGTAPDPNTLHLEQRTTTVQKSTADGGTQTVQHVEERNSGVPGDSLGVTQKRIDIVRPGSNGDSGETHTIQTLSPADSLTTVWVDTTQGKNSSVQVDMKAAESKNADAKKTTAPAKQ
jgi:hypothetical protein